MAKYLLIESRDTFESKDVSRYYDLAKGLKQDGNDVTLFLVQNGVLAARQNARFAALGAVADDDLHLARQRHDVLLLRRVVPVAEVARLEKAKHNAIGILHGSKVRAGIQRQLLEVGLPVVAGVESYD